MCWGWGAGTRCGPLVLWLLNKIRDLTRSFSNILKSTQGDRCVSSTARWVCNSRAKHSGHLPLDREPPLRLEPQHKHVLGKSSKSYLAPNSARRFLIHAAQPLRQALASAHTCCWGEDEQIRHPSTVSKESETMLCQSPVPYPTHASRPSTFWDSGIQYLSLTQLKENLSFSLAALQNDNFATTLLS